MSTNSPAARPATTAAAKPKLSDVKSLLESDAFRAQIARALPKHITPDRMIRVAITAAMKSPKLILCTAESLTGALLTCSQFGLEPDGRRAHLIPYENRKKGTFEAQLIIDYKGLAELAMRSGLVANIHADVVRENDVFEYDRGEIKSHKIDFRKPRGEAFAFYAICRFRDGSEKADVMSLEEIEAIRARSKSPNDGPWATDPVEMAKKTVFRRLSKWLPMSPEFRDAVDADGDGHEMIDVTPPKAAAPKLSGAPAMAVLTEPQTEPDTIYTDPVEQPAADDQIPGAEVPAAPASGAPTMSETQEALAAFVAECKATFDQFRTAVMRLNWFPLAEAWSEYIDIPDSTAKRLLGAKHGLKNELAKGGA